MAITLPPELRFTADEAGRAFDEWRFNCGPGAIAAVLGLSIDELRPRLCGFEQKGYTNPSLMWEILRGLNTSFRSRRPAHDRDWPTYGLARVQWEGPWTAEGVPAPAAYRHTHWVGSYQPEGGQTAVFDINALQSGGWISVVDWAEKLVPWILSECEPKASGGWRLTHSVEIKL